MSVDLPVLGAAPSERADAARNRRRILDAARRLFAERGVSCTSMDAIAAEAGVGKGTLFRRFGDRATLALAVLDDSERDMQEAILRGPPPLGPGAPPAERLEAFGAAMLKRLETNRDLLLVIEGAPDGAYLRSGARAVHRMHVRALVTEAKPEGDGDYVTDVLLAALGAQLVAHQRRERGMSLERLRAGYAELVDRLLTL